MNWLFSLLLTVHILVALAIIGLVLMQHGKGADMGAAFGSGASGSLFGATGSSNFLSKSTGIAAAIFFAATLALAFFGGRHTTTSGGVMDSLPATPAATIPAPAAAPNAAASAPANASVPVPAAATATNSSGQAGQIPK